MKSPLVLVTMLLLVFSSCERENLAIKLREEAATKILGKWMVEQTVKEIYDPLPTLKETLIEQPTNQDYLDFVSKTFVEVSSSASGKSHEAYKVWNPYQVMIGDVGWWIEKLTDKELHLKLDRNDAVQYKRFVTKIYLKR